MKYLAFVALLVVTLGQKAESTSLTERIARRTHQATKIAARLRMNVFAHDSSRSHRALQRPPATCDSAFMKCIGVNQCVDCFMQLQTHNVDWTTVTKDTSCSAVVKLLHDNGLCQLLDEKGTDMFCSTFNDCVIWDDDNAAGGGNQDKKENGTNIDCSKLKECNWEGFHPSFIGNGICNDGMYGCYNTEICGYDGGDCCPDTCVNSTSLVECGHDGYACRNPASTKCNPNLSYNCNSGIIQNDDATSDKEVFVKCADSEQKYRIIMYDSFGDGWDDTKLVLTEDNSSGKTIYSGSLKTGSQGIKFVCLSKEPKCYDVTVKGGVWGNEVSWEVKPLTDAPAIAGGGAPMECNFGVNGAKCQSTCSGKPNIDPSKDPAYKELKDLYACIEDKCVIQAGQCKNDAVCEKCFQQDTGDYCYGNDAFNAIVDCSLCKCSDRENKAFCDSKLAPGRPANIPSEDKQDQKMRECSPTETLQGGAAVMTFANCSAIDQVSMIVTNYDENNFGDLDRFEACAHEFGSQSKKTGKRTALECLQILVNATQAENGQNASGAPVKAIAALARLLYHDAENFCDCAKQASDTCPLCSSFLHFKTLLYETMDACQSLDEIDCDAWKEFYNPCKTHLGEKFGTVDFSRKEQCDFVHNNCGGAGPFPSFRRLDCGKELANEEWEFYKLFADSCIEGFSPDKFKPEPVPEPRPSAPVASPTNPSGFSPVYFPPKDKPVTPTVPYTPSDDDGNKQSRSSSYKPKKGRSSRFRWLWNLMLVCAFAYIINFLYTRRTDCLNFVRYRRIRNNYYQDDTDMYSGLALESSTNFEPIHLPPTPMQS